MVTDAVFVKLALVCNTWVFQSKTATGVVVGKSFMNGKYVEHRKTENSKSVTENRDFEKKVCLSDFNCDFGKDQNKQRLKHLSAYCLLLVQDLKTVVLVKLLNFIIEWGFKFQLNDTVFPIYNDQNEQSWGFREG